MDKVSRPVPVLGFSFHEFHSHEVDVASVKNEYGNLRKEHGDKDFVLISPNVVVAHAKSMSKDSLPNRALIQRFIYANYGVGKRMVGVHKPWEDKPIFTTRMNVPLVK